MFENKFCLNLKRWIACMVEKEDMTNVVRNFLEIIFKISGDRKLALGTATLFCVHPINAMLVNDVTVTVISTFVILLQISFLLFCNYLNERKKIYVVGSLLCFVLALLSHEMSLFFPVYLLCLLIFLKRHEINRHIGLICLPYVLIAVAYLFFDGSFLG